MLIFATEKIKIRAKHKEKRIMNLFLLFSSFWIIALILYLSVGYYAMKKTSVVVTAALFNKNGDRLGTLFFSSKNFMRFVILSRKRRHLSRNEFSKKVGIHHSELIAMEYGYKFSHESLLRLFDYMNVDYNQLFIASIMKSGVTFESAANYTVEVEYPNPDFDGFAFKQIPIVKLYIKLTG